MNLIRVVIVYFISVGAIAQESSTFESKAFGFKITKPDGWEFVSSEENREIVESMQTDDENIKNLVLKRLQDPLVTIMKAPTSVDLYPGIKVATKPYQEVKASDPKGALELVLLGFQKLFKNHSLTQPPIDTSVDNSPAAYMRVDYSMTAPDGQVIPATLETWVVPRPDYFFLIGATSRQDEKTGSRDEISTIIESIEL